MVIYINITYGCIHIYTYSFGYLYIYIYIYIIHIDNIYGYILSNMVFNGLHLEINGVTSEIHGIHQISARSRRLVVDQIEKCEEINSMVEIK